MKKKISSLILISLSFTIFVNNTYLNAQVEERHKNNSQVVLSNTETISIKSSYVDQEYKLQIFIPPTYTDTSKYFPVLYLLDSDKSFGMSNDYFLI